MRRSVALLAALVACLAGCATTTNVKLPDPAQQTSVIEYVRELRVATATLGDAAVVRLLPAPPTEYPDYRWWWQSWCPRHEQLNNGPQLMERIYWYCRTRGGVFHEPACTDQTDQSTVLFFARFDSKSATCGGAATPVGVQLAEPKPGTRMSAAFVELLHKGGWLSADERRTASDVLASKKVAAATADENARQQEAARLARELPQLKTRGTRICRKDKNWIWVAYTEDATDRKIQIRIADVRYAEGISPGSRPGGFTAGQIVWDFPDHWYVCE